MKIDLEELFGIAPIQRKNFKKASHLSQASTSLGFEESAMKKHQIKESLQKTNEDWTLKLRKKTANETMRILQSNKKESQGYKFYIETKLDQQQGKKNPITIKNKSKQLSKQQALKLSARLSQPRKCTKEFCDKICSYEMYRRIKQQNLPLDAPLKEHKRSLTQICQFQTQNPSKLHEGLYWEYKAREFRNLELANEYEEIREDSNRRFRYQNAEYDQNYVPFYDRLGQELDKRAKRQQFYENNVIEHGKIIEFNPDTSISKHSLNWKNKQSTLRPKRQKNQLKGSAEMRVLQRLSNSLNKSFESVLNRSVQIVQEKEEKLIAKVRLLFEDDGYFRVKPEAIQELDEKEFEIFCPLIAKLEKQDKMDIDQFQNKFRKYLQDLPKQDKLALRKNGIRKQKQQKIKIKQEKSRTSHHPSAKTPLSNTTSRVGKDYLQKIRNFI